MSDARPKWFSPADVPSSGIFAIRILFAALIYWTVPAAIGLGAQPHPVGLAHVFDLTFLSEPGVMSTIRLCLIPILVVYVLGRLPLLTLTLMLLATVLPGTLDNSQGSIQHSQQAISLITLAQLLYHLAARTKFIDHDRLQNGRWEIFMGQQAIVAAYTVTALTKLLRSGLGWITDSANFPIQMTKNIRMQYYNTLEAETVEGFWAKTSAAAQQLFLDSPNLCRVLLTSGLLLELFAILALLGRRWAAGYGALLITFHLLVRTMTGLNFRFHIAAILIFLILPALAIKVANTFSKRKSPGVS
jgi:hypothetical protein